MTSWLVGLAFAGPLQSLTAAQGQYANAIPVGTVANPYTEVCWVGGARLFDLHPFGGPTTGGSCSPGDIGFVIEHDTRPAATWDEAREECLLDGMRIPEPFEWLVACKDAATLGVNSVTNAAQQWIGSALYVEPGNGVLASAASGNTTDCSYLAFAILAVQGVPQYTREFRCVK